MCLRAIFLFVHLNIEVRKNNNKQNKQTDEQTNKKTAVNAIRVTRRFSKISHVYSLQYYWKEGTFLFNDALDTFYLMLFGVEHIVKDHLDSDTDNYIWTISDLQQSFLLFFYGPSHIQDNTFHSFFFFFWLIYGLKYWVEKCRSIEGHVKPYLIHVLKHVLVRDQNV